MSTSQALDANKSTNVRPFKQRFPPATAWIGKALRLLSQLGPSLAARTAARLFFTAPPRRRPTAAELLTLATGRRHDLAVTTRRGNARLATWTWGDSGPVVLLVHGWGGNASQLHAFVQPLVNAGFRPVAVDLPGHGESAGRFTSLPEWADALLDLSRQLDQLDRASQRATPTGMTSTSHETTGQPFHAVIAHSFGAAATTLALDRGLAATQVSLLAPVAHPASYFDAFMALVSDDQQCHQLAREAAEARLDFTFGALGVPFLAARQTATALVVHDRNDRETPFDGGEAIARAWPTAELVATNGLGHRRLLEDAAVVSRVVDQLRDSISPPQRCATNGCGRAVDPTAAGRCASCDLEHELAHPELRWVAA